MSVSDLTSMYEHYLEENARARGNYGSFHFTPRPLTRAIIEVMRPKPGELICDPACGTGVFLAACYDRIFSNFQLDKEQLYHLRNEALTGWEPEQAARKRAMTNLYIRGVVLRQDMLIKLGSAFDYSSYDSKHDMLITNVVTHPSIMQEAKPTDSWTNLSNLQLNYLCRTRTLLKENGRAAVVVPDHVLFDGGRSGGEIVRHQLLETLDFHTLLRLPLGILPGTGAKANVLFFDKPAFGSRTKNLWVFDMRTMPNSHLSFEDFVSCYRSEDRKERKETRNFIPYAFEDLVARVDVNLDIGINQAR